MAIERAWLVTRDETMIHRGFVRAGVVEWPRIGLLLFSLLLSACSGASGGHPPVYPVHGKVLYKGKPLAAGVVLFELQGPCVSGQDGQRDQPLRVTGKIGDEGSFSLNAYPGETGVPEGQYRVSITPRAGRSESGLFGKEALSVVKGKDASVISSKYSNISTSGLEARVVADQPNEPVFDLK